MIRRLVNPFLDRQTWADGLGGFLQRLYLAVLRPVPLLKDFLHGTWLGHALHPVITDVPIGALTVALFLEIIGFREAANWAILAGVVAMVGAAVTGIADYTGMDGKDRRYGTIHSVLMMTSLAIYTVSLLMRFDVLAGSIQTAFVLSIVGYLILSAGAYVGGEIVYGLGYMVDRHAYRHGGAKWTALDQSDFVEGQLTKVKAGAQTLVVVRHGERIQALHDVCAHAGCSLAAGKIVDGQLECQCHGSRFRLSDGKVSRGPATYDQPHYEVRRGELGLEVRRTTSD